MNDMIDVGGGCLVSKRAAEAYGRVVAEYQSNPEAYLAKARGDYPYDNYTATAATGGHQDPGGRTSRPLGDVADPVGGSPAVVGSNGEVGDQGAMSPEELDAAARARARETNAKFPRGCSHCGEMVIQADSRFCSACGKPNPPVIGAVAAKALERRIEKVIASGAVTKAIIKRLEAIKEIEAREPTSADVDDATRELLMLSSIRAHDDDTGRRETHQAATDRVVRGNMDAYRLHAAAVRDGSAGRAAVKSRAPSRREAAAAITEAAKVIMKARRISYVEAVDAVMKSEGAQDLYRLHSRRNAVAVD